MKTNDLRKQKTAYYRWQKSRLEALLAVVQRKEEFINIVRKLSTEEAIERVAIHFNISSRQVNYLLGLELRKLMSLEYDDLQKEYEKVVRYCQILGRNNKKL